MKKAHWMAAAMLLPILMLGGLAVAQMHGRMKGKMMPQTRASKRAEKAVDKIKNGKNYNCCIKGKCDYCAVHMGSCMCGPNASMGKPVCINCKGGWAAGLGIIPGKTNSDITAMPMNGMVMGKMKMKMPGDSP